MTCFRTGWRDSNGFFRTMVTTIHKLNTGGFNALGFLSDSEMLHLGGTPYTIVALPSFAPLSAVQCLHRVLHRPDRP
jgi:hypothetical protein